MISDDNIKTFSPCLQVGDLTEGNFYWFQVQAANLAGVGLPSAPSESMKCEAWTMDEPGKSRVDTSQTTILQLEQPDMMFISLLQGPAYDLSFSEVRSHSLIILWKAPVYTGASAVTGYFVDMAKKGSSDFVTLNQEAVSHCYLQVGA